jgi:glycerol uptake facilitator-like aquaporin
MFGEFAGTAILVLLGDGVVAGVLLKGSKSEGAGWLAITAGWAFAVVAGVFTAICPARCGFGVICCLRGQMPSVLCGRTC